jgi:hypothetical protein
MCALVAGMEVENGAPRRVTDGLRDDGDGVSEPIGFDIHGEQASVVRLRLERHRAREPPALERIDRVGADIGADVDEHSVRRQPVAGREHGDRLVNLAPLPFAMPH